MSLRKARGFFFDLQGTIHFGSMHAVGGKSLKMTCKLHKGERCVCWISNVVDERAGEPKLVEWLSKGIGESKDFHQELALDLKKEYGMRVRKTPEKR